MDLDDDYKFALDSEVNKQYRRTDAIRSSLWQLEALREKVDWRVFIQRRADLLQEYSHEVDKENGTNTYINLALNFAKQADRECTREGWKSIYRQRLDEGMSPAEIITSFNSNFEPLIELSKKFKEANKNRVLYLGNPNCSNSLSQESTSLTAKSDVNEGISNLLIRMIEKQIKNTGNTSPKRKQQVSTCSRSSPTRVSGIFKKRVNNSNHLTWGFQADNNLEQQFMTFDESPSNSQEELNLTKMDKTKREPKSSFVSGLEKHLIDQVADNRIQPQQARKIVEDVRKNYVPFKNPIKMSVGNGGSEDINNRDNEQTCSLINDDRLKGIEKPMIELIQSEIITNLTDTDWSHIAGLNFAKSKIQQIAILPLKRPDLFTGIRAPPKGILLFGPPGTGKTMIGRCIASQAKATFFSITSSTLTSKWIGDGEKAMKTLFAVARCLKPSVIFIDEVDSLLKSRSDSEHESSRRMKTEFLAQFDGLSNQSNDGLLVIGTTNRPQELDEAVRRRFAAKLYISLPDKQARHHMIVNNLCNERHCLTEQEIDQIAENTEGYSGSDMRHLCSEAAMYSFREVFELLADINKDDIRDICYQDFVQALTIVKPSFSSDDLQEYEQWNKKYGSDY